MCTRRAGRRFGSGSREQMEARRRQAAGRRAVGDRGAGLIRRCASVRRRRGSVVVTFVPPRSPARQIWSARSGELLDPRGRAGRRGGDPLGRLDRADGRPVEPPADPALAGCCPDCLPRRSGRRGGLAPARRAGAAGGQGGGRRPAAATRCRRRRHRCTLTTSDRRLAGRAQRRPARARHPAGVTEDGDPPAVYAADDPVAAVRDLPLAHRGAGCAGAARDRTELGPGSVRGPVSTTDGGRCSCRAHDRSGVLDAIVAHARRTTPTRRAASSPARRARTGPSGWCR